ncbi:hypothetical protein WNY59_09630 [Ahrensia kielensis]|uniref:Uncharacterized protein n=1 Tax=Ahrensia kielensis TaxID=76980 RepID=A0ABU9T6U0_9HYPH
MNEQKKYSISEFPHLRAVRTIAKVANLERQFRGMALILGVFTISMLALPAGNTVGNIAAMAFILIACHGAYIGFKSRKMLRTNKKQELPCQ